MARSGSPICAATRANTSIGAGPSTASFSSGSTLIACSDKSERRGFVSKAHIDQRQISDEDIVIRLFLEERFQFDARLPPTFLGSGMVARHVLCPA